MSSQNCAANEFRDLRDYNPKVCDGPCQCFRTVVDHAKDIVAPATKQAPDLPGGVAVVNVEYAIPLRFRGSQADRTLAALRFKHRVISGECNTIFADQVPLPRLNLDRLVAALVVIGLGKPPFALSLTATRLAS
jgi:hypothetical protein